MSGKGYSAYPAILKQGSVWGTAVEGTTNAGFPYLSESISAPDAEEDESITGKTWGNEPDVPNQSHQGEVEAYFRYGANSELVMALAMGTAGTPSSMSEGYSHALSLADGNDKFATLGIDKDADVWEYESAVISKLIVRGTAGGRMMIIPEFLGRSLSRNTSSGTNNNTTKANITTPYANSRGIDIAYFSQGRFRLNTDAGALDAADEVFPANFEFTLENMYEPDFTANDAHPKMMSQPTRARRPKVTGFFEFPERAGQTYDDLFWNKTPFKFDLLLTSTILIGSVVYYDWLFEFPYCRVTSPNNANIGGAERIGNRVEFAALQPDFAPTGMDATKAFWAKIKNNTSTQLVT